MSMTRREQGLAAMGLTLWQLRRPECLVLHPTVTIGSATDTGTPSTARRPVLWWQGPPPAWLDSLGGWLAGHAIVCAPLDSSACQPGDLLLQMEPALPGVAGISVLPGYAGKRAVWQGLCASGWWQDAA